MKDTYCVELRPITVDNWKECINLKVHPQQEGYVPANIYSIAEAQFYPDACPLAVYNHEQQMVGFVMYGLDIVSGKWKLFRLMIDAHHQSKGYSKAATVQVLKKLKQKPDCDQGLVCYQRENTLAQGLYGQLGFVEQSCDDEGVCTAVFAVI